MKRYLWLLALLSLNACVVNTTDAFEDADDVPVELDTNDSWEPSTPKDKGPSQGCSDGFTIGPFGVRLPTACNLFHIDKGDPPPENGYDVAAKKIQGQVE